MGKFGEPWIDLEDDESDIGHVNIWSDGGDGKCLVCTGDRDLRRDLWPRIVACVNAMAGLDPERVREFMDDVLATECSDVHVNIFGSPCGDCWSCRARACREDDDA